MDCESGAPPLAGSATGTHYAYWETVKFYIGQGCDKSREKNISIK